MKLEYRHNNSGGSWWLTDADWKAMEAAGWVVEWRDKGFIGASATSASIETDNPEQSVQEWERVTGQRAADEGCNCCGPPHSFSYEDNQGNWHYSDILTTSTREWT